MKKEVLGIKINDISVAEIVHTTEGWLKTGGKHYIVTPNPEIVVMAQKDEELKNILNNSDLSIPDGNGLKIATDIVCNSPGIDVMEALIKLSAEKAFTTGFLGGAPGVAEKTAECLQKKYKNLKVSFVSDGGEIDDNGEARSKRQEAGNRKQETGGKKQENAKEQTLASGLLPPDLDILFVAFGPPKQEKWIAKNLDKIPVKVAMTVGGSFDYISGGVLRAPLFMRNLGLEWLFRLIVQPWRIKRQLALIKYIWLLTKHRLNMLSSK